MANEDVSICTQEESNREEGGKKVRRRMKPGRNAEVTKERRGAGKEHTKILRVRQ
jgi:hypothetical protein